MVSFVLTNSSNIIVDCIESNMELPDQYYGCFRIGPLFKGQGITLGNALRRILLENMESVAITKVKIKNVNHEFHSIPGVRESVLDIIFNIKKICLKGKIDDSLKASLNVTGPCIVTSNDITLPNGIQCVQTNQYIANISSDTNISMELYLGVGCGDLQIIPNTMEDLSSYISTDPVFMPIEKVNYRIQYDSSHSNIKKEYLDLEIWTNKTIYPDIALKNAAQILSSLIQPISNFGQTQAQKPSFKSEFQFHEILIEELPLSVRAYNCLKRAKIYTLADLLKYTKDDLLEIKNFGEKSADEVIQSVQKFLGVKNLKL